MLTVTLYCYSFAQGPGDAILNTDYERQVLSFKVQLPDSLRLKAFMIYDSTSSLDNLRSHEHQLELLVDNLSSQRSRFKNDTKFITHVFNHVRSAYLKNYEKYIPFNDMITHGRFNCLTGTALYNYIFYELGYETRIYETHFHCFLILKLPSGSDVLVDAADRTYGLIIDKAQVEKKILLYQKTEEEIAADENMFPVNHYPSIKAVSPLELAGLQYFNFAVVDFNNSEYQRAYLNLLKASTLYPSSDRIKDLISYINREKLEKLPKHFSITGN